MNGPWKEGRIGGVSLCYEGLSGAWLEIVTQHHARVGIRATVVCATADDALRPLAELNWDLALGAPFSAAAELQAIDKNHDRGVFVREKAAIPDNMAICYKVSEVSGILPTPGLGQTGQLPSLMASGGIDELQAAMEATAAAGAWGIWRFNQNALDKLGEKEHQQLLSWLGDNHARIWCAPVRDISRW